MTRPLTLGERELIEDALKEYAFRYRVVFINAASKVAERLNIDDEQGLAKLTQTELSFFKKSEALDNLATVFRRYEIVIATGVEVPEQA